MFLIACFSTRAVIDDNYLVDNSPYSIEGKYSITFDFPQPYGEMYADLEIYFEENNIKSDLFYKSNFPTEIYDYFKKQYLSTPINT